MKFTSEDLLKAMGLKLGDIIECKALSKTLWFTVNKQDNKYVLISSLGGSYSITMLVDYIYTIIQPKPILTEDEKVILRSLDKQYQWISRDEHKDELFVYVNKPKRLNDCYEMTVYCERICAFKHLFQFIKWEDEPYSIEELLKEN